jgi:hypothetical protein
MLCSYSMTQWMMKSSFRMRWNYSNFSLMISDDEIHKYDTLRNCTTSLSSANPSYSCILQLDHAKVSNRSDRS